MVVFNAAADDGDDDKDVDDDDEDDDDEDDDDDNDDGQAKYGDYDESTYQPGLLANEELLPQRVSFSNSN